MSEVTCVDCGQKLFQFYVVNGREPLCQNCAQRILNNQIASNPPTTITLPHEKHDPVCEVIPKSTFARLDGPPFFEDDQECLYCQRPIGEPHKPGCRQGEPK